MGVPLSKKTRAERKAMAAPKMVTAVKAFNEAGANARRWKPGGASGKTAWSGKSSSGGGGKVFSLSGQRRKPYVPRDEEYYTIMYDEEPRITTDVTCTICKGFERSAKIQCRVCGRNCHTNCFERRYRGDEQAMEASKRADTEAGWTCADCENLGQLLDEYETSMLMDKFDEYDSDQSTQITLEEYIEFQKDLCLESEGIELSKEREEEERELFGNIDISGDGAINWWEFLTAKSIHFLKKKPRVRFDDVI
ncbi:PHF24 [Branchiostoma lanceolatum]|uniref:PHF24 protein n=1 Tax=Branchiostoma lanceolatum TaxID=7740 RepID=A0A8J9YY15_BRALA|nr:PHF24 [Branchiostoma lanceolatum]